MLYRFLFILIFLFSNMYSQSLFNRFLPQEHYLGDARSMGMGNTFLTATSTSMVILSNPAKISKLKNTFDIQSSLLSVTERRSMVVLDGWDEFLTETDYATNQNNYLNHSFGLTYSFTSKKVNKYEK